MLKAALLEGRKPWQDGYDEGFKSGKHHGYQAGYSDGYNKAVQELMTAKADPASVPVEQPTIVQPVHGVIVGDRLVEMAPRA
jgi:flagellar biosynthesis/type III secretory pathway protein FliH